MHTNQLQKTISRVFPNSTVAATVEIIFLLGIGMIAVALHTKLRVPMQLPGKQGLLFMALILSAKGLSRFPFAASLSGIGAATILLIPGLGFHDPLIALNYLFLGCLIDLVAGFTSRFTTNTWLLALFCGACWVFIPIFRLLMSLFIVMPLGAFRNGIFYPFATYLVFGTAGSIIAAGLVTLANKKA